MYGSVLSGRQLAAVLCGVRCGIVHDILLDAAIAAAQQMWLTAADQDC
jgi:hypothetical protein